MSSSVVFLSAVTIDDLSLAMRAPPFPADGKASRLIFVGVCVSATACLSNTCSERARYVTLTSSVSPLSVSTVETCTSSV